MIRLALKPTAALEASLEFEQLANSWEFDLRMRAKSKTGEQLHGFRFQPRDYQEGDAGLIAIADAFIRCEQLLKAKSPIRTARGPLRFNEHSVGLSNFRIFLRRYGSRADLSVEAFCLVEGEIYARLHGSCSPIAAIRFGSEMRDLVLAGRPQD